MSELVSNFKAVKSLRFNNPVFSPGNDYVVTAGSLAIILENLNGGSSYEQSSDKAAA